MQKQSETFIKEIFTSVQGEGPYVGCEHIFVRFCKCNLACKFCDTDFKIDNAKKYSTNELFKILKNNPCETISFTGGEPLLDVDYIKEFLENYKNILNKKIYLETNGTIPKELEKIIDLTDIVSMDIKLKSATEQENQFDKNEKFLDISSKKEHFIKIIFDKNIQNEEINSCIELAKKHNSLIVLQPKMPMEKDMNLEKIFKKFSSNYKNTRLIPQVHKFLNLA